MIKILPNFTYQLQLASGAVESHIKTKPQIKQFLNGMYGGTGPNGEKGFDVRKGVLFENLGVLRKTPLLGEEELEVYTEEFSRNGMGGGGECCFLLLPFPFLAPNLRVAVSKMEGGEANVCTFGGSVLVSESGGEFPG